MPRYAIADIYGRANTSQEALKRLDLKTTDELFFLGDHIDIDNSVLIWKG